MKQKELYLKPNSTYDILDELKKLGALKYDTPYGEKPILFISGFSHTLKSTLINRMKNFYNTEIITSPVKLIHKLNYSFNATAIISSITFFYAQFYAMYTSMITNKRDAFYIIERGLWDYLYFLKKFNYMNTLFKSIDELNVDQIIKDVYNYLELTQDKVITLVLKNESDILIDKAVNSNEETRKLAYKDRNEYIDSQNEYLDFILPIVEKASGNILRVSITDDLLK